MIVQNDGALIRLSNEFVWELFTRDEALQLIEELTEAIRLCPVDVSSDSCHRELCDMLAREDGFDSAHAPAELPALAIAEDQPNDKAHFSEVSDSERRIK